MAKKKKVEKVLVARINDSEEMLSVLMDVCDVLASHKLVETRNIGGEPAFNTRQIICSLLKLAVIADESLTNHGRVREVAK
jgi:hypothetical protein